MGLLAPLALAMGMPFSIGMGAASRRAGAPTAFLWGINGATSVVASVLGALIAMFFGITVAFASGFLAYLVAAVSLVLIVRSTLRDSAAPGDATPTAGPAGDGVEGTTDPADGNGVGAAEDDIEVAPATSSAGAS